MSVRENFNEPKKINERESDRPQPTAPSRRLNFVPDSGVAGNVVVVVGVGFTQDATATRLRFSSRNHFIMNPAISAFESVAQTCGRFPVENLLDQRVVAVAAVHAFGRGEIVTAFQFHPGDLFHDVDQLIDRDQLAAAEIERLDEIAVHDHLRSLHAIVDLHEAARLMAVAPDFDFVFARKVSPSITLRQIAAGAFSRPPS